MTAGWRIQHSHGDAAAFHASVPPAERSVTFHAVDRPTLVLGSAQRPDAVDHRVAHALGVEVVGRRSGGGAVLLLPGEFVWADVVLPAGDPLWLDDVGAAMRWVGEWWASALGVLGTHGAVHLGGLVASRWSRQVCWAGVGTGEVMAGPSKLVGISQRRTRTSARFQTMCHLAWRPELVAALVAPGDDGARPVAAELASCAAVVASTADRVVELLEDRLPG